MTFLLIEQLTFCSPARFEIYNDLLKYNFIGRRASLTFSKVCSKRGYEALAPRNVRLGSKFELMNAQLAQNCTVFSLTGAESLLQMIRLLGTRWVVNLSGANLDYLVGFEDVG